MNAKWIEVLENLDKHIIFDKHINKICFSAEFIKNKQEIIKFLKNMN